MQATDIQGGCFCGKLRYRTTCEPIHSTMCHCANCRRASGGQVVAWLTFPSQCFSLVQREPVEYRSPTGAVWSFCGNCGTTLTYLGASRQDEIDVTTGSADEPEAFPPKEQVNVDEKLSWVAL